MSRTAQNARLLKSADQRLLDEAWLQSALVTTQVVDVEDAAAFPEMALAREHARRLAAAIEGEKS